jgi:hypothetical protein
LTEIIEDRSVGYRLSIRCVADCALPAAYQEAVSDSPMGLFWQDRDDLIVSSWSGGSAYRVRVWQITDKGIARVLEASSRSRPEFLSSADGQLVVQTHMSEGGSSPMHLERWTFERGSFHRDVGASD